MTKSYTGGLLLKENKSAFIREKSSILKCFDFVALINTSTAKSFTY